MKEYKLINAVNKETKQQTQTKYINDIGIVTIYNDRLMFVPTSESKGSGFITSIVVQEIKNEDDLTIETLNSIYYFVSE